MESAKFTADDLKMMQAWPLEKKVRVSLTRILEFGQKLGGASLCVILRRKRLNCTA